MVRFKSYLSGKLESRRASSLLWYFLLRILRDKTDEQNLQPCLHTIIDLRPPDLDPRMINLDLLNLVHPIMGMLPQPHIHLQIPLS
jgi:hypothetical protein